MGVWGRAVGTICPETPTHCGMASLRVKKERGLGARLGASNRDAFFFKSENGTISPCTSYLKIQRKVPIVWLKKKSLMLQFHRADQYYSLNANLWPSEMQMRLCSESQPASH